MATQQLQLVCDSSTYANFSQWASAISAAFATFGWAQSNDTGQVMWSGMSISAVSMSGSNATYTYSSLTGLALAVGRALTITAMGNSGNNGTFVITALGSGTFTVVNASGVNASSQSGAVTVQSTAPGSGAYFYEVWTPNDGLTNFYLKLEYGNISGTNCPTCRLTLCTGTNGAGTATGLIVGPTTTNNSAYSIPSSTTQFECDFSGALGRFSVLMWRNTTSSPWVFSVERSLNSSGTYTGTHVTLIVAGYNAIVSQQTLLFGVGALYSAGNPGNGVAVRTVSGGSESGSTALNGSIPVDFAAPCVGYYDYPLTTIGIGWGPDLAEGVTFTTTLYGATRTYMVSKTPAAGRGPLGTLGAGSNTFAWCVRYD